jgi:hypothetical protein
MFDQRTTRMKLVFGMASATERPDVIEQVVDLLDGRPVILHHDWSKQPALRVHRPNLHYVDVTHQTGWGTWGLCEAVLSTMRYALEHLDFDYFQLISPSCMPLRPIDEFEVHLAEDPAEGHIDLVDIQTDADVLVNYGWRMYAPRGSIRQRFLRRARAVYFGPDALRVQRFGLSVASDTRVSPTLQVRIARRAAMGAVQLLSSPGLSGHPFSPTFRAYVGSLWFGASRALCADIVRVASEPRIVDYFSRLVIPDEFVFPTLIGNSGRRLAPANHFINTFNDRGSPRVFKPGDIDTLLASKAFFARKFPSSVHSPLRTTLIERRLMAIPAVPSTISSHAGSQKGATRGTGAIRRPVKVIYGTMTETPGAGGAAAVAALAAVLQGRVLIVHDAAGIDRTDLASIPNLEWASAPLTGGFRPDRFNAGLLQLLKYCIECVDFDYLQLLPLDSVPTSGVDTFEHFVERSEFDVHADLFRLKSAHAFARHAARVCRGGRSAFAPVLRWIGEHHPEDQRAGPCSFVELMSMHIASVARLLLPLRHPPLRGLVPSVGSPWFGASRDAVQHLVRFATARQWVDYATTIDDAGAVLFSTLLTDGTFLVGPSNLAETPDIVASPGTFERRNAWFARRGIPAREAGHKDRTASMSKVEFVRSA